eukprot:TRINITY_DN17723_c0_g1_i2.p1 TRINITY_DN17723_c0_g1~~TRINITY_DN17723_c0_g1_i2.p1  ORF type:complete len:643 (+),score=169.74 TRINITY_DN17723_c0_g1_i2:160-2088(+)
MCIRDRSTGVRNLLDMARGRRAKKRVTPDVTLKLLVVGDAGTGKSSLVNTYAGGDFDSKYVSTVGIDLKITKMQIEGHHLRVQIWDTSGDDKYFSITKGYYAQADGIVLCYNRAQQSSFDSLPKWIEQIERGVRPGQDCDKILIALGDDMDNKVVSNQAGEKVAQENGMQFFSTSSKESPEGVYLAINKLVEVVKQRKHPGVKINASSDLKDIGKEVASPEQQLQQSITSPDMSAALKQLPELDMTEALELVVDFLKSKKLNRTCDLLHEEWRLHAAAGSSHLETGSKLEELIARKGQAGRTLGEPQEGLLEGEIGVGDTGDVGAPCTSVEDTAENTAERVEDVASTVRLTEAQIATQAELKGEHPYGSYGVYNLKIIYNPNKTGFEESADFPIKTGTVIAGRYQILDYIGSAAFSHAVQCSDLVTGDLCCCKIIKNNKDFFDQGLDEIKLLKYIQRMGDADEWNVVEIWDYFYHKEHLFIVCELLRDNLYEVQRYLKESGDPPYFTMPRIWSVAQQVLKGLMFVHRLGLIHCDLKPENILIKSFSRCEVKTIDFGSTCFTTDHLTSYVQSRSYRAPEVILGCSYGPKIDIWSLGCILAELWTGDVLFENSSIQYLLAKVNAFVGPYPEACLLYTSPSPRDS